MRGLTKIVTIEGKDYTVRELSVLEIRNWIGGLDERAFDMVDELLIEGAQLSAIREMTGISAEQMDALLPSEVDLLVATAKEVNPRFFSMVTRVLDLARSMKPGKN